MSLPPGYDPWRPELGRIAMPANFDEPAHWERVQIGAELWWARWVELADPLHDAAMCRLLGISRHTLTAVEYGPRFPDLAMVVRVGAVTGRRLVLTETDADLRVPPWAAD